MRPKQTQTDARMGLALESCAESTTSASSLGDDLTRSRLFCLKAGAEMTAIVEASRTPATVSGQPALGRDPIWLCERLGIIQREAKRARARAIYRSAQDVLSLIQRCNVHMPIDWTRVDGRLFVLNKLIGQYEDGLVELEALSPPETLDPLPSSTDDTPEQYFDPVHEIAKQTLDSLLPHAREAERDSLRRLIEIDVTAVEPEQDLTETSSPVEAHPTAPDRIEWIMPGLVQDLLEIGRDYGKLFSVSHTLDDVLIEAGTSDQVRARLFERLTHIVSSDLPLQGVGRMDISAKEDGLRISGSGFEPVIIELQERVFPSLEAIARDIETPLEKLPPTKTPFITEDVEAELREQLAALISGPADEGV